MIHHVNYSQLMKEKEQAIEIRRKYIKAGFTDSAAAVVLLLERP